MFLWLADYALVEEEHLLRLPWTDVEKKIEPLQLQFHIMSSKMNYEITSKAPSRTVWTQHYMFVLTISREAHVH